MRNHFSSQIGFIAAAAGSAVGLGNIWKFPFEVGQNGGAAFLLMYLLFCFILCFPILLAEISIGRSAQSNAIGAFKVLGHSRWSFVGQLSVLSCVLIFSFYIVVAGWSLGYLFEMVNGNFAVGQHFPAFVSNAKMIALYAGLFMAATALIVSQGVKKGVEQASKWLMPLLILMVIALSAYALTLPNAIEGVKFYLIPDFSKIDLQVIYKALGHAFFSLSLGMGSLITYGSYLDKQSNIVRAAVAITLIDVLVAFSAGFMLFPLVFSQGLDTDGGPGLVFMALPSVFASLGSGWSVLIGSAFFLLLSFAALTSTVALLEIPTAYLQEKYCLPRKKAVWIIAAIVMFLSIPSLLANGRSAYFSEFISYFGKDKPIDFMTFISDVAGNTFLPLGGLLLSLFAAYAWKKEKVIQELQINLQKKSGKYLALFIGIGIRYISPLVLTCILVLTILDTFFGIVLL